MTDFLARNQPYVAQGPTSVRAAPSYNTALSPIDEIAFRQWLTQNKVPFDPDASQSDYDMRGYWRALQQGDPRATSGTNANDGQLHYTDTFKTPLHESFSDGSQWAAPVAPQWNDKDQLVSPGARILKDEPAEAAARQSDEFKLPEPAQSTTRLGDIE